MKSILLSIKPEWVAKILNGEKTVEIRKKFPKDYAGWVYIYCTKGNQYCLVGIKNNKTYCEKCGKNSMYDPNRNYLGNGEVVARFWCDKVEDIIWRFNGDEDIYSNDEDTLLEKSCLSHYELHNYLQRQLGYAIHISKLEVFDKPRELSDFYKESVCFNCYGFDDCPNKYKCVGQRLTKAPQNYCYIESEE